MHAIWDTKLVDAVIAGGVYDLAYMADQATKNRSGKSRRPEILMLGDRI